VQKDDANFVNSDPDVGVNKHCDADVKPNSDSNAVGTGSIPDLASFLKVSTKTLIDSEVGI